MKAWLKEWLWICTLTLIGVQCVEASENRSKKEWVSIQDRAKQASVSFPQRPVYMSFDFPLEGTEQLGHLDVYSVPQHKELFMFHLFDSPFLSEKTLEAPLFEKTFYSVIIQRMFFQPKRMEHQRFKQERVSLDGLPAVRFSISYIEKSVPYELTGLAVLQDRRLYILFYLAAKQEFNQETAQKFMWSFAAKSEGTRS